MGSSQYLDIHRNSKENIEKKKASKGSQYRPLARPMANQTDKTKEQGRIFSKTSCLESCLHRGPSLLLLLVSRAVGSVTDEFSPPPPPTKNKQKKVRPTPSPEADLMESVKNPLCFFIFFIGLSFFTIFFFTFIACTYINYSEINILDTFLIQQVKCYSNIHG